MMEGQIGINMVHEEKKIKRRELIRTDKIFFEDMMEINAKRENIGNKKLSDRKILELVRRHTYWPAIMEDIISHDEE